MGLAMFVAIPASARWSRARRADRRARSSSAARSTRPPRTRRRARSSGRAARSGRSRPCGRRVPAFYALGDTRTPVRRERARPRARSSSSRSRCAGRWATSGISVAVAGSSAVQMVLLVVRAARRMGRLGRGDIGGRRRARSPRRAWRRRGVGGRAAGAASLAGASRASPRWPSSACLRRRRLGGALRSSRRSWAACGGGWRASTTMSKRDCPRDARRGRGRSPARSTPAAARRRAAEVAFAGRSNVGKSSLLNAMMQRGPGAHQQHAGVHPAAQHVRGRCADGRRGALRRPAGLRLGEALEEREEARGG